MTNEHENRKRPLIEEMSQESQGGSSAGHADGTSTPELFSTPPPTATWADSKDPEQPDSEVSVPAALQFLENNGVSFTLVPRFISSGGHPGIQKKLSVTFAVDTVVTSHDIILGFDAAGIDVEDIVSIQRKPSNKSWIVLFRSAEVKEKVLSLASVTIAGCQVFIGDVENSTVLVKIYEAPDEMPDTV